MAGRLGNFRIIIKNDGEQYIDAHREFVDTKNMNVAFMTWAGMVSITCALTSSGRYRLRITLGKHPWSHQGADNIVVFDGYSDGRAE